MKSNNSNIRSDYRLVCFSPFIGFLLDTAIRFKLAPIFKTALASALLIWELTALENRQQAADILRLFSMFVAFSLPHIVTASLAILVYVQGQKTGPQCVSEISNVCI